MTITQEEFWKLLDSSQLVHVTQSERLREEYSSMKGVGQRDNARTLAQWLIATKVITDYQSSILLSGLDGPFFYGDYKVTERLDLGGDMDFFRAIHVPTTHPVVLRFVSGSTVSSREALSSLVSRTDAFRNMAPKRCVQVYDLVDLDQFKFLVMEDPPGQSLRRLLGGVGRLPADEALRIGREMATILSRLHALSVTHGDIRPGVIWIEPSGAVRLWLDPSCEPTPLNFALAADKTTLLRADYAAPELGRLNSVPDELCDVYALGVTLYQAITGKVPFPGGAALQKMARHASEAIKPLDQIAPVSSDGAKTIAFMMAKQRDIRIATTAAAAERLALLLGTDQKAPSPTTLATLPIFLRRVEEDQVKRPPIEFDAGPMSEYAIVTEPPDEETAEPPPPPPGQTSEAPDGATNGPPPLPDETENSQKSPVLWIIIVILLLVFMVLGGLGALGAFIFYN